MENYSKQWDDCLAKIRGKVNDERVYKTWFADVRFESYDEQQNTIIVRVPSNYVYEYLEQNCIRLLSWGCSEAGFKPGVRLGYRIAKEPTFAQLEDYLRQQGFDTGTGKPRFRIPDARNRLEAGLKHYLGDGYQWLPAYDRVADWLGDNKGRGLLCVGTCGLGKTLVCTRILPVLLGRKIPSCTAIEMNSRIDELLKERCVIIDDLGKEPVETITYGNRRTPFFELCDAAERQGKLLIITTNLSTTPDKRYPASIQERYGEPVIGRLRSITRAIEFTGEDLRR